MDMIYNIANYLHMLAALALLMKIWCTQDCSGISGKTQFLYALVFTTRYLDLFTKYISPENTIFKILYLILAYSTALSIFVFFRKTYERKYDTLRIEMLIIPCLVIALLINYMFEALEVLWTFSIYLEAVAILPQFHFVAKAKRLHKHVFYYILALGSYKCLYILHWIYRYYTEERYDKFSVAGGIVQFILYCDFFGRVMPYLKADAVADQLANLATVSAISGNDVEDGGKNGHLNGNISTVVLTPGSLMVGAGSDKVHLLKAQEANANVCSVEK